MQEDLNLTQLYRHSPKHAHKSPAFCDRYSLIVVLKSRIYINVISEWKNTDLNIYKQWIEDARQQNIRIYKHSYTNSKLLERKIWQEEIEEGAVYNDFMWLDLVIFKICPKLIKSTFYPALLDHSKSDILKFTERRVLKTNVQRRYSTSTYRNVRECHQYEKLLY